MKKKGLSLFTSYLILLLPVIVAGVIMIGWFQTGYLLSAPERHWSAMRTSIPIAFVLGCLIALAVFIITRPFQKIMNKYEQTGTPLTPAETQTVLKTYNKMNIASIIGMIIGFVVGDGGVILVRYINGVYDGTTLQLTIAIIHACIYAGFVSIILVYVTDFIFAKFRRRLHIHDTSKFKQNWNIALTLRLAVFLSFIFIISNIMMIGFTQMPRANGPDYMKKILFGSVLVLVPSYGIILLMLVTLNNRIASAEKHFRSLAEGTATEQIDIINTDDFGSLTTSVNGLIVKLQILVSRIQHETQVIGDVSQSLDTVSKEVSDVLKSVTTSYDKIAEEGKNQKNEIAETEHDVHGLTDSVRDVENHIVEQNNVMEDCAAAIVEMTENIKSLGGMTEKADAVSKELSQTCEESRISITNATNAIMEIQTTSVEVVGILDTLQKISTKTNLLAMNAAIEAAHAGEVGKGFAVVADEVRSLAASSATSAKNIESKIAEMTHRIEAGVAAIELIKSSFEKIQNSVEKNTMISSEITQALREQQAGADHGMRATKLASDETVKVKQLALGQHTFTTNVDSSMKSVVPSTENMSQAITAGVEATKEMQDVVVRIDEMIKSNKDVVAGLKEIMDEFSN